MRDSLRQRVYDAESRWRVGDKEFTRNFPGAPSHKRWFVASYLTEADTLLEIKRFISSVRSTPEVMRRFPADAGKTWHVAKLKRGSTMAGQAWSRSRKVAFCLRFGVSISVVLHEMAHVLVGSGCNGRPGHDWRFAETMVFLAKVVHGADASDNLATCYRAFKVPIENDPSKHRAHVVWAWNKFGPDGEGRPWVTFQYVTRDGRWDVARLRPSSDRSGAVVVNTTSRSGAASVGDVIPWDVFDHVRMI